MPFKKTNTSESRGLTATARDRTNSHAVLPRQIIDSLTRDGDYFLFPLSKSRSVRRWAKNASMKVLVTKRNGKGYVERIYTNYGSRYEDDYKTNPVGVVEILNDKIDNLEWEKKGLIKYLSEAIVKLRGIDDEWCNRAEPRCK